MKLITKYEVKVENKNLESPVSEINGGSLHYIKERLSLLWYKNIS